MARRYVRGDRAFGRLLKRLPQSVTDELRAQLNSTGRQLLALEQRQAAVGPGRYGAGAMRDALTMQVSPVRLTLKVGLVGKPINRKFFYAWFVEFGRKAGGRGTKRGSDKYTRGVGAMPARHFVYVQNRNDIYLPFKAIWDRSLANAASGVSDD